MRPAAVPSPCIDVCRMDGERGLCEGCHRTLDEIAAWGTMDDAGKLRVWAQLPARRAETLRRAAHGNEGAAE